MVFRAICVSGIIFCAVCIISSIFGNRGYGRFIIAEDSVTVYSMNDVCSKPIGKIGYGTEVYPIRVEDMWVLCSYRDGVNPTKEGWIQITKIAEV